MNSLIYKRGFTMIELLVVIGIIGVLSVVLFLSGTEAREDAKIKKIRAELQNVQVAMELYKADHGQYPDPTDDDKTWCNGLPIDGIHFAITGNGGTAFCEDEPIAAGLVPDYIHTLPGQTADYPSCGFVYITTYDRDAYKFFAGGCIGAGSQAEGIQPDDEMARCPSTCNTCGIQYAPSENWPAYDPTHRGFYDALAIYSDGGQCW